MPAHPQHAARSTMDGFDEDHTRGLLAELGMGGAFAEVCVCVTVCVCLCERREERERERERKRMSEAEPERRRVRWVVHVATCPMALTWPRCTGPRWVC